MTHHEQELEIKRPQLPDRLIEGSSQIPSEAVMKEKRKNVPREVKSPRAQDWEQASRQFRKREAIERGDAFRRFEEEMETVRRGADEISIGVVLFRGL